MDLSPEHIATIKARRETAQEWFSCEDKDNYYRHSKALPEELKAWHQEPGRASWTNSIVELAKKTDRHVAIDIGCGWGYELVALRDAGLVVCGVEPNHVMRKEVQKHAIPCLAGLSAVPLKDADLVLCMDVLEHLENPQAMLDEITQRVGVNTILVEHTPTWDLADPLHPVDNYGWLVPEHIGPLWRRLSPSEDTVGIWQRL